MRMHIACLSTRQDQDLAVRLQYAAQRRASDEALRGSPEHTRWIAPDTAFLLRAILTDEVCRLETSKLVE